MTVTDDVGSKKRDRGSDSIFELIKSRQPTVSIYNHELNITDQIRKAHPNHHLTLTNGCWMDLEGFVEAGLAQMSIVKDSDAYLAERSFDAPSEVTAKVTEDVGSFRDVRYYACIIYSFESIEYIIYHINWMQGNAPNDQLFILSPLEAQTVDIQGNSPLNDRLIKSLYMWTRVLHDEIYVFDQGQWTKSKLLYQAVQNATWEDVVLHPSTKASIIADINTFFNNRELYAEFNVPWKRGVILHGPPGNGKTLTIKALINELGSRKDNPIPSLHVKSLVNDMGGEYALGCIFDLARKTAPCILVFEDLDSLVTDKLRSYFLNELDGLEANDGILMIGSTNHLGKLDPAIAKRPSRFDRKYAFELPGHQQRLDYAKHWQSKFERNPRVSFNTEAALFFAQVTQDYSFAYMKELFVTSLMISASDSSDQIETELDSTLRTVDKDADHDRSAKIAKLFASLPVPESLANNKFVQILHKQAAVLRYEMDSITEAKPDAKKSTEEPAD
ncbi:MAG: hypothetical protein Q9159_003435 [Coniocarpon cinnabarinum]